MLLVVCGAGASYDSVSSRLPSKHPPDQLSDRPPLADELFADRQGFVAIMDRYPELRPLVPRLQHLTQGRSLEQVMEQIRREGETNPVRLKQLAAIRYYLQAIIWRCQARWLKEAHNITNYVTLFDRIEHTRLKDEQVCIVTFNYDTLIEEALPIVNVSITDIEKYPQHHYALFKLHGSVDWARRVDSVDKYPGDADAARLAHALIDDAAALKLGDAYVKISSYPPPREYGVPLFPAIALPVEQKREFECPQRHLKFLRESLGEVRKALIIGWRGTESHFLDLVREKQRHSINVLAACGNKDESERTIQRIKKAGVQCNSHSTAVGFTDLVVGDELGEFLAIK